MERMFNPPHPGKILRDALGDRYFPGVCSLFLGNAHNRFMVSSAPKISRRTRRANYPTPPPFRAMHVKTMTLHQ